MMGTRCAVLVDTGGRDYGFFEVVAVIDIQQDVIAMLVSHMRPAEEVGLAIEVAAIGGIELVENQPLYVLDGDQTIDLASQPGESVAVGVTCHFCPSL
jgi:hypothetical protein